jgi:hypothetical protein
MAAKVIKKAAIRRVRTVSRGEGKDNGMVRLLESEQMNRNSRDYSKRKMDFGTLIGKK